MDFIQLFSSQNFDLVSVGVTVAAISILGISVYVTNSRSITGLTFTTFAFVIIAYAISNFLSSRLVDVELTIWALRLTIFFAIWSSFLQFQLFYVFPDESRRFPVWYRWVLVPYVGFVSLLTLSPYVFSGVAKVAVNGQAAVATVGPAVAIFGLTSAILVILSAVLLVRSWLKSRERVAKRQMLFIMIGYLVTFTGILLFNVALPLVTLNTRFLVFAPLWFFPFLAFTAYAILRYKLFDIKTAAVSSLSFLLAVTIIVEAIFSTDIWQQFFSIAQFVLVVAFGFWLVQATTREVKQREKIEKLAKDLESANSRLKELDRQKTEFVSIASHQLRAPLTAIKGYASLLLERSYGDFPVPLKDPLEKIYESSRLMVNSIEDFLNISRIELGRMKYDMTTFDLTDLTKKVVSELMPVATKKGLTMQFANTATCTVNADIGKIKQVITNFVDNAIKYSEKGSIDVSLACGDGKARISVKDTGIGMSKETIDSLFEKFTRARDANKINVTGTGLGLFVAKQLVEGHKGRVWVESEGEGKGSTFYIELPIS